MGRWTTTTLAIGLAMGLAACGGDDDDGDNGLGAPSGSTECRERTGAYTFTYTEKSGDCGPVDPGIVVIGGQSSSGDGCTGGQVPSASDSCLVSLDVTCPGAQGTSLTQVGQVRWSLDGNSASGTIQVSLSDSAGLLLCQSTYDLRVTR